MIGGLDLDRIDAWFQRIQVSAAIRGQIYDTLSMLLEQNVLLVDALSEMYDVHSDDGRKPRKPSALMLAECLRVVSEGRPLSEALANWVSAEEAAIIAAGEKSSKLSLAFKDALSIIAARKKIVGAIVGKAILTAMPLVVLCILLRIVATKLVPSLQTAAPAETWTGSARILYYAAEYVNHFGLATLVVVLATIIGVLVSLPLLTGNMRYHLDRFPPWSIYRIVTGAIALQNIAVLIRSNVRMHDALQFLSSISTPYLQERLDAAVMGTNKGLNLGEALEAAEHNFPDREAIKYLRLLAGRDGFDGALSRFATAWIETSVLKVQAAMTVFMYVSILGVGACAGLVVDAGAEIQNIIEHNADRASQ